MHNNNNNIIIIIIFYKQNIIIHLLYDYHIFEIGLDLLVRNVFKIQFEYAFH